MSRYLLLASEREADHDFCHRVAERAGLNFLAVGSDTILEKRLKENKKQSLVFWDVDFPDAENPSHKFSISKILPILEENINPRHIFGLGDCSMFDLPAPRRLSSVNHYCVRNYTPFGVEWIAQLVGPIFSPGPFGLDYYQEPGSITQGLELKVSTDKKVALQAVTDILKKSKIEYRATQMILRSVDELLMNAIFDAPVDKNGVRYRRELGLDETFELNGKERVTLSFLVNTRSTVIGVYDHFGSFSQKAAQSLIQKDYTETKYNVDPTTKAAGLGLRGIAASGLGTIISCQQGFGTEAVIAFPHYDTFKETKTGFRSFSLNIHE